MKTVFLLFDSLNLRMLNSYGGTYIETPNFNRLAKNQFNLIIIMLEVCRVCQQEEICIPED